MNVRVVTSLTGRELSWPGERAIHRGDPDEFQDKNYFSGRRRPLHDLLFKPVQRAAS